MTSTIPAATSEEAANEVAHPVPGPNDVSSCPTNEAANEVTHPVPDPKDVSPNPTTKMEKMFVYPWMASRNFDLLWFFAPILVALAGLYLIQNFPIFGTGLLLFFVVNAFGIGPAHQGPTWFFYFDKRNREYWSADKKRMFLYYVAPALVFAISVLLAVFVPILGLLITTFWGLQHFVQQNFGITLLYHNKNNNEAIPDRNLLLRSLWTPSILFASIFYFKLITTGSTELSTAPIQISGIVIFTLLGIWALFDVGRVLFDIRKQVRAGARVNVPAFMFWLVSVLYYLPFIFPGQKIETVALIPGTMHWCQYIGLNMILVKQKYGSEDRKGDIPFGGTMLLTGLCIAWSLFILLDVGMKEQFAPNSVLFWLLLGVYQGFANVHYFQDAFFWRFREKFQRDNIMPFLLKARTLPAVQGGVPEGRS